MTELLPCPFCGFQADDLGFGEGSTFRWLSWWCLGCGVGDEERLQTIGEGDPQQWMEEAKTRAFTRWNTRYVAGAKNLSSDSSASIEAPKPVD